MYLLMNKFQVNTTPSRQILPVGLAKILLGKAMDLILNCLERAVKTSFQKMYTFTRLRLTVFELWLFVLQGVATT